MDYLNPPVVEVSLTFNISPSSQTPEWGEETGVDFIKGFDFPKHGRVLNQNIHIISDAKSGTTYTSTPPYTIKEVIAKNNEETEILGVGKNYLTFHKLRQNNDYPHYTLVKENFFKYLPCYKEFWKPEKIQNIILSYVDIIEIPEDKFDIDKYLKIGVKFPEDMGTINLFETHLVFQPRTEYDTGLNLQLSQLPGSDHNTVYFYLFWNCFKKVCDESRLADDLEVIHKFSRESFENSLTEKCKQLFNPKN